MCACGRWPPSKLVLQLPDLFVRRLSSTYPENDSPQLDNAQARSHIVTTFCSRRAENPVAQSPKPFWLSCASMCKSFIWATASGYSFANKVLNVATKAAPPYYDLAVASAPLPSVSIVRRISAHGIRARIAGGLPRSWLAHLRQMHQALMRDHMVAALFEFSRKERAPTNL